MVRKSLLDYFCAVKMLDFFVDGVFVIFRFFFF